VEVEEGSVQREAGRSIDVLVIFSLTAQERCAFCILVCRLFLFL